MPICVNEIKNQIFHSQSNYPFMQTSKQPVLFGMHLATSPRNDKILHSSLRFINLIVMPNHVWGVRIGKT